MGQWLSGACRNLWLAWHLDGLYWVWSFKKRTVTEKERERETENTITCLIISIFYLVSMAVPRWCWLHYFYLPAGDDLVHSVIYYYITCLPLFFWESLWSHFVVFYWLLYYFRNLYYYWRASPFYSSIFFSASLGFYNITYSTKLSQFDLINYKSKVRKK